MVPYIMDQIWPRFQIWFFVNLEKIWNFHRFQNQVEGLYFDSIKLESGLDVLNRTYENSDIGGYFEDIWMIFSSTPNTCDRDFKIDFWSIMKICGIFMDFKNKIKVYILTLKSRKCVLTSWIERVKILTSVDFLMIFWW